MYRDGMRQPRIIRPARTIRAILWDIRSVHNVGSMFRTSDGVGVEHIYLAGYTPSPKDRFGRPRADLAKVALGAEESVPWTAVPDEKVLRRTLTALKKEGFTIVALEQTPASLKLGSPECAALCAKHDKIALIVGNETGGVPEWLITLADNAIEIPMHGKKESLNVSVAFGIAVYTLKGL